MNLVSIALLVVAFILAIVGVVVAVGRPTTKAAPVFALVISSLLLIGVFVLFALSLVAAPVDGDAVESAIEAGYLTDSGTVVTVDCPVDPPSTDGSVFLCSATNDAGIVDVVEVRVQGDSFTWEVVAE